mmetsp:Transcript_9093/g.20270  ORF Transcript_9093/g.20270 Transcript_9093/m.20270 type:complete len:222 (-) Transcript_9093:1044-1709(-)
MTGQLSWAASSKPTSSSSSAAAVFSTESTAASADPFDVPCEGKADSFTSSAVLSTSFSTSFFVSSFLASSFLHSGFDCFLPDFLASLGGSSTLMPELEPFPCFDAATAALICCGSSTAGMPATSATEEVVGSSERSPGIMFVTPSSSLSNSLPCCKRFPFKAGNCLKSIPFAASTNVGISGKSPDDKLYLLATCWHTWSMSASNLLFLESTPIILGISFRK